MLHTLFRLLNAYRYNWPFGWLIVYAVALSGSFSLVLLLITDPSTYGYYYAENGPSEVLQTLLIALTAVTGAIGGLRNKEVIWRLSGIILCCFAVVLLVREIPNCRAMGGTLSVCFSEFQSMSMTAIVVAIAAVYGLWQLYTHPEITIAAAHPRYCWPILLVVGIGLASQALDIARAKAAEESLEIIAYCVMAAVGIANAFLPKPKL
ncbi:MAG: hypothetical protein R3D43_00010 [Tepidamorphaceae bacterium]|nr:hypothetical protein [Rhodobiaceae bacterium]MCB1527927.1 hypothetical protein [Hyphomicrobiaceae bacterium]MCC0048937.1 hypothetical protein [Rhodobiaceae bacterium]